MSNVGFIGLGQMGFPMASNLVKKGHCVKVFDINKNCVDKLAQSGAIACKEAKDVTIDSEFIITMLPNGQLVDSVLFGENDVANNISNNSIYIDMSTISPFETDTIRQKLSVKGIKMLDCPVGRTSADAITGTLLIIAGGDNSDIDRAKEVLLCMGNEIVNAGGPGMGIRLKIVNNYMSIALNALSAEAAVLCESMGLNLDIAIKMMSGTAAGKGHFTTTWPSKILKGDLEPAFMIDLAHKDLGIATDIANKLHAPLFMGACARELYNSASAFGYGKKDWTALLQHLRNLQHGNK